MDLELRLGNRSTMYLTIYFWSHKLRISRNIHNKLEKKSLHLGMHSYFICFESSMIKVHIFCDLILFSKIE